MKIPRLVLMALLGLAMVIALADDAEEDVSQPNQELMQIQTKLKELGYYYGACNGLMGENTIVAIENFQKANGISVTGEMDETLIKQLSGDQVVTKKEYIENAVRGEVFEITLSPGDSGKTVKRLQTRLNELGYYSGKIDSRYNAETEHAVKLFQFINDLTVTGLADPDTLYAMTSSGAVQGSEELFSSVIRYGDEGSNVKLLQLDLTDLGYFTGECSGKFGRKTQEAMMVFQKANGLEITGECDVEQAILILSGEAVDRWQADETEATKSLILGDDDVCVTTVKAQLNDLGFYNGEMGSLFTQELAQSVSYFQEANQIPPTGIADTQTRVRLNEPDAVNMDGYCEMMKSRTSRLGDANYAVTLLQMRLSELGYYTDAITGVFDKTTQSAVMYVQKVNMLMENGEADAALIEFLYGESAANAESAESNYHALMEDNQRRRIIDSLCETALKCVSMPYEGGKIGPDSFGNGGLVYFCLDCVGVRIEPTVTLQLENARLCESWNENALCVEEGQQVFYRSGETVFTGIYVGDRVFVYASPERGMVIAVENMAEMEGYEFIGSVSYV